MLTSQPSFVASEHRRLLRAAVVLVLTALPWVALALLARDLMPGHRSWINPAFAATLFTTYVGAWLAAIAASALPRRMLLRALATSSVLLLLIAIAELPAMLRLIHWNLIFRTLAQEGGDYKTAYVLDEQLSFRRIPGLHWSGRPPSDVEDSYGLPRTLEQPITFTYDRWGYRNATDMPQADVVLLGDSMVEGWYVSDAQTVAAQLASRLQRPVANLGVAGYGTLQQLRVLKGDALARKPTAIAWFFFEGNDLYDDQTFSNALVAGPPTAADLAASRGGLTHTHGWRERSFVINLFQRIRRASDPVIPAQAPFWARLPGHDQRVYFFPYSAVPWTDYEEMRWAIARAAFEDGVAFARDRGLALMFLYVPEKYRVFRDFIEVPAGSAIHGWNVWPLLPVRFRDFCTEAGALCLDLTDQLRDAVAHGGLPYHLNDTHWSPEGHAIAAAAVSRLLEQAGAREPPCCRAQ